jgi:hypothetical protein
MTANQNPILRDKGKRLTPSAGGGPALGPRRRAALASWVAVAALAAVLASCQTRVVTVTQEVTREVRVEVTVLVTPTGRGKLPATPDMAATKQAPGTPEAAGTRQPKPGGTALAQTPAVAAAAATPGPGAPYPDAPLCPDTGAAHDNSRFHTLWDTTRGCHYDHEHGADPFTPDVAAVFPDSDLPALLGNVQIGHTNPSGPMENTHKHGGFKWNVQLAHPQGCQGFEDATNGVNGSVIEYHGFGDYAVELEASIHSALALLRLCNTADPADYGYLFTVQHISYGEIVSPYQGDLLPYPYYTWPPYDPARGPYLSVECIGQKLEGQRSECRHTLAEAQAAGHSSSVWTSKPTGHGERPQNSALFGLLWRAEDVYRALDWRDQEHPYTFLWLCTADGGATYDPAGCAYNNTTTQVSEIAGTIPADWDNLADFDRDPQVGRITAEGYTTSFGDLNLSCTAPGPDCFPIKMVRAFVGTYGSVLVLTNGKGTNLVPINPERDIYFCAGQVCAASDPGAVPSGWVGPGN